MRTQPLIVLKFGGSVLLDEDSLRIAVHEIYRWRRDGWRVVAVVSAFSGRTEELLARCRRLSPHATDAATATVLASGETEAAALLAVHLDRAGIPACTLTPAGVGLVAAGSPLDAEPVAVMEQRFHDAIDTQGVVVFPGFQAIDEHGRTVTLGRGGSDLTALYLAHALGADACRLIKDVDGLYTSDPAAGAQPTARYSTCSYADALATTGSVLQHKATRFAQRVGLRFELGRFNGVRPTVIGTPQSTFEDPPDRPTKLTVALAGPGTVGGGVIELLAQLPGLFELVGVCCRDPRKHEDLGRTHVPLGTDPRSCLTDSDVVVELIGGTSTAGDIARDVLASGKQLVTANKALLAKHGDELKQLADAAGGRLLNSASVGGALPVIEHVCARHVLRVRGVLNGTGNFVLEQCRQGLDFNDAIAAAQSLGFAEADPSRDLNGTDCLDKLLVLAQHLGWNTDTLSTTTTPICRSPYPHDAPDCWRHVGTLDENGAHVELEAVHPTDPLFDLAGEMNAIVIEHADGSVQTLRGRGAGRWPTAESVLADLLDLSRHHAHTSTEIAHVS